MGFPADGFCLGAKSNNKWVIVMASTLSQGKKFGESQFLEIANTLEFDSANVAEDESAPKPQLSASENKPTATEDEEPVDTGAEGKSLANKLGNLTPHALIAIYAALGITAAIVAFFFVFRLQRRRRAEAFARTKEIYEKKLVQWEKEGYDVKGIREKLKGSGED